MTTGESDQRANARGAVVVLLMGVAGAGKTTVGRRLAEALGWEFIDGDDYHLPRSVEKMSRGIPLDDADRWEWLDRLKEMIRWRLDRGTPAVVTCSALKKIYRDRLRSGNGDLLFMYLKAPEAVIRSRISTRAGHFFDPVLLASQYETLEEPRNGIVLDATKDLEVVVSDAIEALRRQGYAPT